MTKRIVKIHQWYDIVGLAVRQLSLPAVYVSNNLAYDTPEDNEIWRFVQDQMKAIFGEGTTEFYDVMGALVNGSTFFFDTSEEQDRFYQVFNQPPVYASGMFAMTFSADGSGSDENT